MAEEGRIDGEGELRKTPRSISWDYINILKLDQDKGHIFFLLSHSEREVV